MSNDSSSSFQCRFFDLTIPKFSAISHVDPFAIVEASLTSVKYTFYHIVGYGVLYHVLPYNFPPTTLVTSAASGFIGGALFSIPFLISLGRGDDATYTEPTNLISYQLYLIGAESFYSMMGGGIGILALGDWSYTGIAMGIFRGFVGPLTVFTVLFILLKLTLAVVSSIAL